jgi:hypothetical protein
VVIPVGAGTEVVVVVFVELVFVDVLEVFVDDVLVEVEEVLVEDVLVVEVVAWVPGTHCEYQSFYKFAKSQS